MARNGDERRGGHLPPGHAPGPQSRRSARGVPIGLTLLALGAVGLAGGSVALFLTASHAKSPSGARAGGAILAGAAVLLLALFGWMLRRTHPHVARYLQLSVDPIEVRRGGTVNATLAIADTDKLGEKLELGLICTEYYDCKQEVVTENGTSTQRVTRHIDIVDSWSEADHGQVQQTVRFTVPNDSPFSYEGSAVSWAWHVTAVDRHSHRPDGRCDVPIWVSP